MREEYQMKIFFNPKGIQAVMIEESGIINEEIFREVIRQRKSFQQRLKEFEEERKKATLNK